MTVREIIEIIERVDEIELVMEELRRESKDLDLDLVCDILEEYREVLLDKTVK